MKDPCPDDVNTLAAALLCCAGRGSSFLFFRFFLPLLFSHRMALSSFPLTSLLPLTHHLSLASIMPPLLSQPYPSPRSSFPVDGAFNESCNLGKKPIHYQSILAPSQNN